MFSQRQLPPVTHRVGRGLKQHQDIMNTCVSFLLPTCTLHRTDHRQASWLNRAALYAVEKRPDRPTRPKSRRLLRCQRMKTHRSGPHAAVDRFDTHSDIGLANGTCKSMKGSGISFRIVEDEATVIPSAISKIAMREYIFCSRWREASTCLSA